MIPNHIIDIPVGQAIAEATGQAVEPTFVENPGLRGVLEETYGRLAEAADTGRAAFTPAETALILEVANAAYRRGIEVGAAPVSWDPEIIVNVVPFQN